MNNLRELIIQATAKDRKKDLPCDDDAHGFHDHLDIIDDPINTNDYKIPLKQVEPTCSVIEALAPPDSEETNTQCQNVPIATHSEIEINENKV